jgi:predicted alpha/beta superfamily hydrolase
MKRMAMQNGWWLLWASGIPLGCCSNSTSTSPAAQGCPSQAPVVAAAPAAATSATRPALLTLANTEVRVLHSELTGKDHQVIYGLPPSFAKEPTRRYPVLYLLDGQWDFTLLNMLSGGLRFDQVMPEMLIVGLSYAGADPDYDALRADDYVPTQGKNHDGKLVGGGGKKFLEFIEKSVIPLAEGEYRADPTKRILSGSSFGGLFALFALFEKPELFQTYIAISPAAGWDNGYLAKREREFHKAHPKLERRVWLSIGDSEWPDFVKSATAFFRQFEASQYEGLVLKIHTVVGERHSGVKPEAYNRAMRFASEPWLALAKP